MTFGSRAASCSSPSGVSGRPTTISPASCSAARSATAPTGARCLGRRVSVASGWAMSRDGSEIATPKRR